MTFWVTEQSNMCASQAEASAREAEASSREHLDNLLARMEAREHCVFTPHAEQACCT